MSKPVRVRAPTCPVCDSQMRKADVPKYNIYSCISCNELGQFIDGTVVPIGGLLERNILGDDRVRAAVSTPHVSSVSSFLEVFESSRRTSQLQLGIAQGELMSILAQIENRMDFAIGKFSGMDLASDDAGNALGMLREARDLVSVLPGRSRGLQRSKNLDYDDVVNPVKDSVEWDG